MGDQGYTAVRRDIRRAVSPEGIEVWRARGARVLAFVRDEDAARRPSELVEGLRPGDTIILAGPEGVVREIADAL